MPFQVSNRQLAAKIESTQNASISHSSIKRTVPISTPMHANQHLT